MKPDRMEAHEALARELIADGDWSAPAIEATERLLSRGTVVVEGADETHEYVVTVTALVVRKPLEQPLRRW